jgi:hypothetical protein
LLQASIGSNKVCKRFLKKGRCKIKNCTYFHGIPSHDEIIVKHDDISNFCMFEVQKFIGKKMALKNYERLVSHNWPCLKTNSHIPGVKSGIEEKEFKKNLSSQSNAQSQNPSTKPA